MEVRHQVTPSDNPYAYKVEVAIENTSLFPIDPVYRRAIDWDVTPTPFMEYVTIEGDHPELLLGNATGPFSESPLRRPPAANDGPVDLHGPSDLGTIFDLDPTSDIGPGETWEFTMIVGSAPTLAMARQALEDEGASVFGLASHASDDEGTQNVYFLGIAA